ncbi:hypothetical protein [Streptomyces sp. NPDC021622]
MTRHRTEPEDATRQMRDGMACGALSFPLTRFGDDGGLGLEAHRAT